MIRLAFFVVVLVAGILAFGAFSLVRSFGTPQMPQASAPVETPVPVENTTQAEDARHYFLVDQDLSDGDVALVLYRAGNDGETVVVTDIDALRAAQDLAYVNTRTTGAELVLGIMGVPPKQRIAALFRNDEMVLEVRCGSTTCGDFASPDDIEFAGLLGAALPLIPLQETHDTYDGYLDTLTFIQQNSGFALLGRAPGRDETHPVAQQIASGIVALPTIYRSADQPLDVQTHTALLRALIEDAMPDGVTLGALTIHTHDPAIVVDADNRRPATRAGAEIPFPDIAFYTPQFEINGAATLPEDLLESLTENTLLRVDWDDVADRFIQGIGFECADCYDVQIKGDSYNRATVIHSVPERYIIDFYDLRDTP